MEEIKIFIYDHSLAFVMVVDDLIFHQVHLLFDQVFQLNHRREYLSNEVNVLNDEFSLPESKKQRSSIIPPFKK